MHRFIKEFLPDAEGRSEFIISIFIDIREFSTFNKGVESTQSAILIKKFYLKLVNNYFPNASFFKPTGDGLLIIVPYKENTLVEIVNDVLNDCFDIVNTFHTFFEKDPMINFKVPDKVGIGLARGSACYLASGDRVIDYSGNTLNLSARLMDAARPSGIVFDSNFGIDLLSEEMRQEFALDKIYLKSVAETDPIEVYYSKRMTKIGPSLKIPINDLKWETVEFTFTYAEIMTFNRYQHKLPNTPINPSNITIKLVYPHVINNKVTKRNHRYALVENFTYSKEAETSYVIVNYSSIQGLLMGSNLKKTHKIKIKIFYQII